MAAAKQDSSAADNTDIRITHTAEIIRRRVQGGKKLPLEVMLDVMDMYSEQNNYAAAAAMADRAAPYFHPRLRDVMISGSGDDGALPLQLSVTGMKRLSDKELATLEKLLSKAAGG